MVKNVFWEGPGWWWEELSVKVANMKLTLVAGYTKPGRTAGAQPVSVMNWQRVFICISKNSICSKHGSYLQWIFWLQHSEVISSNQNQIKSNKCYLYSLYCLSWLYSLHSEQHPLSSDQRTPTLPCWGKQNNVFLDIVQLCRYITGPQLVAVIATRRTRHGDPQLNPN